MPRLLVPFLLLCTLLAAGCGGDDDSAEDPGPGSEEPPPASLEVTVWLEGQPGPMASETLDCAEPDSRECSLIRSFSPEDFAPTPPNVACTQIYGGPQEAQISGELRGEEIEASFSRVDGCEIERWRRVTPLLEYAAPDLTESLRR